ncbi:dihydrolipoyl dehydrogenase family protein [Alteribacter keqinensis]|uniref:NAD(P)/FAD-dependent oxidoreductase n=1 Tax=Alteribacter keqinensis TaxID=2483800 RepID=A0A3M7TXF1_9BACI|nr:NAD(P)/FAD-dependent oxidoreductase [Alteribacter keqinensis]RNA70287.1 NAD(P)/FAD-dependent oxidoreductase [Alteribacter keqinensis]
MKKYDIAVIGGGAGGLTAAIGAVQFGAKTALIEKDPEPGGDCLHYGCVPSKAYIKAAKELRDAKKAAEEFGLGLSGAPDFSVVKSRVQDAIAEIQPHDDRKRLRSLGIDEYHGTASLKTKNEISIDTGETIYAKRIVIATGSSPMIPPIAGLEDISYLTNETIFSIDRVPLKLVVLGSGPVGIELAQAMSRFGSDVTVIDHSGLMEKEEPEIRELAHHLLSEEMTFMFNRKVTKAQKKAEKIGLTVEGDSGTTQEIECNALLIAAGRKPNVKEMGLEKAGVDVKDGKIVVNKKMQTSVSTIFACGDVTGEYPFTHAAGQEGKTVVANAVFGVKQSVDYTHTPYTIYTDPEVFHLGLTEKEARDEYGDNIHVYRSDARHVDRFTAERNKTGLVKIITDKKGAILGAHAIGTLAGDWMQEVVFAKQHGHKIKDFSSVIHPYPSHGEMVSKAADQYWQKRLFEGKVPKLTETYIKWLR